MDTAFVAVQMGEVADGRIRSPCEMKSKARLGIKLRINDAGSWKTNRETVQPPS